MNRRLKFRHFQCFLEAAKSRRLMDVAATLNITQAAVSKTLTEMEQIVGLKLVNRDRSGVSLTQHGELFHHYAAAGMASFEKGLSGLSDQSNETALELSLGVLPTVAARFLPSALKTLLQQFKQPINIALQTGYNRELYDLLHSGKIDLAIARIGAPEMMYELEFVHLYAEPIVLVSRSNHPILDFPTAERLKAINAYPFLLAPKATRIRPIIEQVFTTLSAPFPTTFIETVSNTFGRSFLPQSDALWMISYGVVEDLVASGALAIVAEPLDSTREPVGMVRRKDQQLIPAMRQLMSILMLQTQGLRPITIPFTNADLGSGVLLPDASIERRQHKA